MSYSEEGWWADSRKNLQEGCENEHLKGAFGGVTGAQWVSDSLKRALQECHPFSHSHLILLLQMGKLRQPLAQDHSVTKGGCEDSSPGALTPEAASGETVRRQEHAWGDFR